MTVDNAREKLIALEVAQTEEEARLVDNRRQLQSLLEDVDETDRRTQERRAAIRQARLDLQREEALAASEFLKDAVAHAGDLMASYARVAVGREWFEGTGMDDEVLDHQFQGMMFGAVAKRWILADAPGLGKTRTALGWLDLINARRVVIVCQPDICDQFAGEVMTYAPHRSLTNIYHLTPSRRHEALDAAVALDEGVIVLNYEVWRQDRDVLAKLLGWQADTVIVDEAHNIKSRRTSNYKNIDLLVTMDNTCAGCGALMKGLYERDGLMRHPVKKVFKTCESCGWNKGNMTRGLDYSDRYSDWLSTKSVQNLLLMTGTPILNDPGDIYPLLHLCDPILFATENAFRDAYCRKNHHSDKWEFRVHAVDNLRPLIEGRYLARSYDDAGIVLPNQRIHIIPVPLDKREYPLQYRTIQQITEQAQILLDSGDSMTIMHLITLITRKRQANVWPGGIEIRDKEGNVVFSVGDEVQESAKMDRLLDEVRSKLKDGYRQVVFSQFKTALAELERRMQAEGIRVARLDGDTPKALREKIKTNFYRALNEEVEYDVVLANYKTGGTGLNLTGATITHILDEEWNPGKRDQAYGRTNRIGQTDETEVYVYRIPGSIDTWMSNGIHRKEMMIGGFNDSMAVNDVSVESLKEAMESGEIL